MNILCQIAVAFSVIVLFIAALVAHAYREEKSWSVREGGGSDNYTTTTGGVRSLEQTYPPEETTTPGAE